LETGFQHVVSIEFDKNLAQQATKKFFDNQNVRILCGDSAVLLGAVFAGSSGLVTLWLDAHNGGQLDVSNCPLISEVSAALLYGQRHSVYILMDDVRLMTNGLLETLLSLLNQNGYGICYEDSPIASGDILVATRK
jgi:hypothetical protein